MNHGQQFVTARKVEGFVFYWHKVIKIKTMIRINNSASVSAQLYL